MWDQIHHIPFGETRSYHDVAKLLGNSHAVCAVTMAANVNPIPLIIPCHRITGNNGQSVHYHYGAEIREQLLTLERKQEPLVGQRVKSN
ncbi:methylated-DNA--[protein]-cysteine S-methyltransferase [Veronia nyctiphanis]|uniref:methylated-DNA--[protein]-cysteine S-methyltransferase n=1 Tax=Veronia nyctiphanis TaxID=1278244 RepID=UPI001F42ABF1|nr:methylated-DNA--[protein]-cysteine S-methyltransferase [Veronia nyctiphanis]